MASSPLKKKTYIQYACKKNIHTIYIPKYTYQKKMHTGDAEQGAGGKVVKTIVVKTIVVKTLVVKTLKKNAYR